ncbi:hypothetical protein GCM10011490_13940 [Pseudoclavibacter endophyticus]|uniref:YhgE/Pip domain-containing protein n=1 Tax=Pseudoclavibacter endophyticus TaxID=1778590 RepID=A0A6H9WMG7_9MICO|nr:YhgE/Pip domain-containing protein [Pseudoclavibacter endophyticus]KAB1649208.1 YhgE/Pip domain-containing protein [Pseudoclavibacter endophyticus]GGA64501.1 hypothetical protein GCM10011490_13940 [Pseudoclavibacter endophyticus]
MTGRTGSTDTTTAVSPDERARKRRNILLAIVLPIVLAIAYLAGMSAADARSSAIPALIVNEDEMVEQTAADGSTSQVVAGRLLVSHLMSPENSYGFDWQLADAQTAVDSLARGDAYVVISIPSNFSASVVSLGTDDPQPARLQITTDQAHDYLSAQAASVLADAVVAQFGQSVTEMIAIGLVQGFDATGEGFQDAAHGAGQLASGADQLEDGFTSYTQGQAEITAGLNEAASGAEQLATGTSQYVAGVDAFAVGASEYAAGAGEFASGASQYISGAQALAAGIGPYTQGVGGVTAQLGAANTAASELAASAAAVANATSGLESAAGALSAAESSYQGGVADELASTADNAAALQAMCPQLPEEQQADCHERTGAISSSAGNATALFDSIFAEDLSGASAAVSQTDALTSKAGEVASLVASANGTAQTVNASSADLADGAQGLAENADPLLAGADQLTAGSEQISSGASQLQAAGAEVTSGTSELSAGIGQLAEGQSQLAEANPALADGLLGLVDGASDLETGLQSGAEQAGGFGDSESYADVLAHPVRADVISQHDPRFGGMLAALSVPIAAWLAAFVTMLARRLITPEALESTASTSRLVRQAFLRLGVPVLGATLGVAVIAHIVGAPWGGILGTITLGALLALAVTAMHLLFVSLFGRRGGAIASLVGLGLQLATLRIILPTELRTGWAELLATFAPLSHASAGLQLIYAGGSAGAVVMSYIALLLIALLSGAAAWLIYERKRRTSLDHLVNLRSIGRPLQPSDV